MDTEIKTTTAVETTKARLDETRANMLAAWDAQSKMTVEDGATMEQAEAAIAQAIQAEQVYRDAYRAHEFALAAEIPQVAPVHPLRKSRQGRGTPRIDLTGLDGLWPCSYDPEM